MKSIQSSAIWMGRLAHGGDLLAELNRICRTHNIRLGRLEGVGAVQQARIGFYDQIKREYVFLSFDSPLEITNLVGNVSLKDNQPFVHAHVTLADHQGRAFGGHLAPGTTIFAAEVIIYSFEGADFHRELDWETGLSLWTDNAS
ncbi:MAG: DNA-binding protein [Magnetococcus sp. YQC-5]